MCDEVLKSPTESFHHHPVAFPAVAELWETATLYLLLRAQHILWCRDRELGSQPRTWKEPLDSEIDSAFFIAGEAVFGALHTFSSLIYVISGSTLAHLQYSFCPEVAQRAKNILTPTRHPAFFVYPVLTELPPNQKVIRFQTKIHQTERAWCWRSGKVSIPETGEAEVTAFTHAQGLPRLQVAVKQSCTFPSHVMSFTPITRGCQHLWSIISLHVGSFPHYESHAPQGKSENSHPRAPLQHRV